MKKSSWWYGIATSTTPRVTAANALVKNSKKSGNGMVVKYYYW